MTRQIVNGRVGRVRAWCGRLKAFLGSILPLFYNSV